MNKSIRLDRGSRRTLRALTDTLTPKNVEVPNLHERMVSFVEGFLPFMPPLLARLFPVGLWLFQWGTLLFFVAPVPFSMLRPDAQRRYVLRWQRSGLAVRRQLIKGLKALILMGYYEQPEVRAHVGYAPEAFMRPLIQQRAERYRARGLAVVTEPHDVLQAPLEPNPSEVLANRGVS